MSAFSVFFGTFANAASVGAKTVNGPLPESVPARPAALTSFTSVVNWPAETAVWTMFMLGFIAAGFEAGRGAPAVAAKAARTRAPSAVTAMARRRMLFMLLLLQWSGRERSRRPGGARQRR